MRQKRREEEKSREGKRREEKIREEKRRDENARREERQIAEREEIIARERERARR